MAQVGTFDDQSPFSRPATPAKSSRVDWTLGESGFDWAPIDTDSYEKFEEVAQQAARGAANKAIDYAVDVMGLLRTNIDNQMKRQTETLRAARNSEEFRQPGQIENLMGPARYLWESNAELKKKIATLETKRQELEGQRTQAAGKMQELRVRVKGLKEEGEKLQRQLEVTRAPPPPAGPDVQKTAPEGSTDAEKRVGQLQQDCERLGGEREALLNQVLELQAINAELGVNLQQANLAIDICLAQIRAPPGTPIILDESILALVTSVGRRPVHGPQLSSQTPLTAPLGPLPSALDTPTIIIIII